MFSQTEPFNIYQYRSYEGYHYRVNRIRGDCDILCVGNCDLASMRPNKIDVFNWFDMLSQKRNCDQIGQVLSFEVFNQYIARYLETYTVPKYILFVIPVLAYTTTINDQLITITENSARVIRFLLRQNIIDQKKAQELEALSLRCAKTDTNDRINYFLNQFEAIGRTLKGNDIQLLWCSNGTKTANRFFRPIIDTLVDRTKDQFTYAGWVENIDNLPESSIGYETQKKIFQNFSRFLL